MQALQRDLGQRHTPAVRRPRLPFGQHDFLRGRAEHLAGHRLDLLRNRARGLDDRCTGDVGRAGRIRALVEGREIRVR